MSKHSLQVCVLLVLLFLGPVADWVPAEEIGAEMVKVSTPSYEASFSEFTPPLGTYTFTVRWQGIPAADVTVNIKQEGFYYHVTANVKTYKLIDLFYRLRYAGESLLSSLDLSPVETVIHQRENSREKLTKIHYLQSGEIESMRTRSKGDQNPKTEVLRFKPDNFTLDPFSAVFLARSLDWRKGISRRFDTFNGKSRYLITLKCVGEDSIRINGVNRDVWIIEPTVRNLTNPKSDRKFRSARIFLSRDRKREVLRIDSKVFVGTVKTRLEDFKPSTESRIPGTIALKEKKRNVYLK